MYIIHLREIQSGNSKANWLQIPIIQLNKTSEVIHLKCDTEYEIAMSARDEVKESVMSNSWHVKTMPASTGIYFNIF